ncbi:hypothetical protein PsYK624_034390 [Phanerochaete sordida]|uniref:Uncharacterized protein n=1 Tax=Phanerochaete sordida TaxID=48140 RepID=A0A9P3L9K1_9APHY|nr:hypothetical protein PsYK624_034390 [Phanerochaete sordida]
MQFTLAISVLATALAVAATPVKRWDNALYVCSDANWSGTCENVGFNNEECIVFPGELQNDITSVGPPQGYYCYLYRNYSCTGDNLSSVVYPGISDLGDGNTDYNDGLNSFKCFGSVGSE